ncbi:MTMR2 protein [Capsaspora owczarzaki ATCC 30864]|uniref:MTMR2 protein n=1 Tax=Capsaspora owczarzaki (strain ATCC 30864) TaxID=595528 RepID=UPI00035255ED|nr:MTMR2 protein [Capsaspora owczarzaki ATCC 30864]|eukprot:XP_004365906.2 MTMR2 protein [Capsaspora owczarzaki ATCC 30864]
MSSAADIPLLPGEELVTSAAEITHLCPFSGALHGVLYVTNYKIYFREQVDNNRVATTVETPLGLISRVDKIGGQSSRGENSYGLELHCKDMRNLRFGFSTRSSNRGQVCDAIMDAAYPLSASTAPAGGAATGSTGGAAAVPALRNVFAFSFRQTFPEDGWSVYNAQAELERQKLPKTWRISKANENYALCDTYPSVIAVPSSVNDDFLARVADFRSRGRLPILSWIHPDNHATITRCSQPRVGVAGKRSPEDEAMLQHIIDANGKVGTLCIMDARPRLSAMANHAKGAGFENEAVYQNTELVFLNIGNIHAMRESLKKLKDMCFPTIDNNKWLSNLEASRWLENICLLLAGTSRIVDLIERSGTSVLVHCSDGWDRTSQLCSLSMMMLDPYYRTIKGFEVLIEKEWLSIGHKFGQRHGHGDKNHGDEQRAPSSGLRSLFNSWMPCGRFRSSSPAHSNSTSECSSPLLIIATRASTAPFCTTAKPFVSAKTSSSAPSHCGR